MNSERSGLIPSHLLTSMENTQQDPALMGTKSAGNHNLVINSALLELGGHSSSASSTDNISNKGDNVTNIINQNNISGSQGDTRHKSETVSDDIITSMNDSNKGNKQPLLFKPPRVIRKVSATLSHKRKIRLNSDRSGEFTPPTTRGDSLETGNDDSSDLCSQSLPTYLATQSFFGLRPHSEVIRASTTKITQQSESELTYRATMSPPSSDYVNSESRVRTSEGARHFKEQNVVGQEMDRYFFTSPIDFSGDFYNISENKSTDNTAASASRSSSSSSPYVGNKGESGNGPSRTEQHIGYYSSGTSECNRDDTTGALLQSNNKNNIDDKLTINAEEENLDLDFDTSSSSPDSVISKDDYLQVQSSCKNSLGEFEEIDNVQTDGVFEDNNNSLDEYSRFSVEKEKDENEQDGVVNRTNTTPETMAERQPKHQIRRLLSKRKSEVLIQCEGLEEKDSTTPDVFVNDSVDGILNSTRLANNVANDNENKNTILGVDVNSLPTSSFHDEDEEDGPCTPTMPKARKVETFDPYQIFEVQNAPCLIFRVRVVRGRNITMGLQDYYDTPDPYVFLHVPTSPEGRKYTSIKTDNPNPIWNEEFTFYINFTQTNILEIRLMESNLFWFDQLVGTVYFDVCNIQEMDVVQRETFIFDGGSAVDMEFFLEFDKNPTLRYSLCLSEAEKTFQKVRKRRVMEGIRALLGEEDGPKTMNEVPTIAVIGSGGGFRAMTAYSGVFKALVETGVLDCVSYAGGLSGSSWLLSTLYSHPKWPNLDMQEFLDEMMNNIDKNLRRFFNPSTMYQYASYMVHKRREGQPVSFTDIFGRMVGETLLPQRMDMTLSDQREKIKDGNTPMPLYTCVHVKKDVPAKTFQEWVEFSPYEIGMPKYGTFMDSTLFGSKFFMGKLVKQYQEQPLHFLQGIWGSAFCILFKRLLDDNRRIDPAEMIRQEMGKQLEDLQNESSSDCSDDDDDNDDNESSVDSTDANDDSQKLSADDNDSMDYAVSDESMDSQIAGSGKTSASEGDSAYDGETEGDDGDDGDEDIPPFPFSNLRKGSVELKQDKNKNKDEQSSDAAAAGEPKTLKGIVRTDSSNFQSLDQTDSLKKSVNWGHCPARKSTDKRKMFAKSSSSMRKSRSGSKGYWKNFMKTIFESDNSFLSILNTRQGRAAVIHNFMRGLSLQQTYPLSPFTPIQDRVKEGDEFDGIFEMHPTSVKNIYMVDAGLTFNSPYPLVLRPQREVDIILSFDFSARPSDDHQPFKELLLAEKWARLNRLPFPPIDLSEFEKDGMKELYIFKHPTDPHCPVVLHFVLVNKKFRYYTKPGIPRKTKEDFDFADFDIFDDPEAPYSTFNFTYTHKSFQRLTKLTEFNTLLHLDDIKSVIRESVLNKRKCPSRYNINTQETFLLSMKSVMAMKKKMHKFIRRLGSTRGSISVTPPFVTPTPDTTPNDSPFFSKYNREFSTASSTDGSVFVTPRENLPDVPDFNGSGSGSMPIPITKGAKRPSLQPVMSPIPNINSEASETHSSSPKFSRKSQSPDFPFGTPPSANESFGFRASQDSVNSFDVPNSSHRHNGNDKTHPSKDSKVFNNAPSTTATTGKKDNANPASSKESSSSADSKSFLDQMKKKPAQPNLFFANFPLKNSFSSSSPSTGSPDSAKYRFSNIAKMQMKKNHTKYIKHPDSPLVQSAMALGKDKFSLRKLLLKNQNASPQSGQSPLANSPINGSPPSGNTPDIQNSQTRKQFVTQPSSDDNFTLAPEAFQINGTPVFDPEEAKKYYDEVKSKRKKMFRRQSTISSLNSMSLDEINEYYFDAVDESKSVNKPFKSASSSIDSGYSSVLSAAVGDSKTPSPSTNHSGSIISSSSSGSKGNNINFHDLSQFEGSTDQDMESSVKRNGGNVLKPTLISTVSMSSDDVWFDTQDSMEHTSS